jgi:hypothetical protein
VGRDQRPGRPRPGYQDAVVAAARDWELAEDYVRSLCGWSRSRVAGARAMEPGEVT